MAVERVVPDLVSTSIEEATGFYGRVLGLQPVMDHGWIVTLADPDRPHVQLSLVTRDATAPAYEVEKAPLAPASTAHRRIGSECSQMSTCVPGSQPSPLTGMVPPGLTVSLVDGAPLAVV